MCGHYRLTAKERYLREHFALDADVSWSPRWNIAPTQPLPIVRQHKSQPPRTFDLVRWGLIPYWAKDRSIAAKTINAMSETAAEKPAFRDAMSLRRCLIPAEGFYEWRAISPKQKQPFTSAWQTILSSPSLGYGNVGEIPLERSWKHAASSRLDPTRLWPTCTTACL